MTDPAASPTASPSLAPTRGLVSRKPTAASSAEPSSVNPSHAPSWVPSEQPSTTMPNAQPSIAMPSRAPAKPSTPPPNNIDPSPVPTTQPKRRTKRMLNWGTADGLYGNIFISVGDTVVWRWSDITPHNVRSTDGKFESSATSSGIGNEYNVTFTAVGVYPFDCSIHPLQMNGVVHVSFTDEEASNDASRGGWTSDMSVILGTVLSALLVFHGTLW